MIELTAYIALLPFLTKGLVFLLNPWLSFNLLEFSIDFLPSFGPIKRSNLYD